MSNLELTRRLDALESRAKNLERESASLLDQIEELRAELGVTKTEAKKSKPAKKKAGRSAKS